jgi:hypothetical protein
LQIPVEFLGFFPEIILVEIISTLLGSGLGIPGFSDYYPLSSFGIDPVIVVIGSLLIGAA